MRKCNIKQYGILHKEGIELVCNNFEVGIFLVPVIIGREVEKNEYD